MTHAPVDGGGIVARKPGAGKRDASMLASDGEPKELGEIGRAEAVKPRGWEGSLEGGTAGGEALDDVGAPLELARDVGSGTCGEARGAGKTLLDVGGAEQDRGSTAAGVAVHSVPHGRGRGPQP